MLHLSVLLPIGGCGSIALRLFLPHCRWIRLCSCDWLGLLGLRWLRGCLPRLLRLFWSLGWAWLGGCGLLDSRFSEQQGLHSSDRLFGEANVYHPSILKPNTSLLLPPWGFAGPLGRAGPDSISGSSCLVRFLAFTPVLLIWGLPRPGMFVRPVW